ncbi:MAG: PQQ-dependent sugar dehydrogenase [Chloroflexota bacterium]
MRQFLLLPWSKLLVIVVLGGLLPATASPSAGRVTAGPIATPQAVSVNLVEFATGLDQPVGMAHAGDGRLFVLEQAGLIRIVEADGNLLTTPFLDITDRVGGTDPEQGLLGLAFDPSYASNGYFYVNYTDEAGDTHIARFSRDPLDPNLADPNSEFTLFTFDQPDNNHNGGALAFGPDGYLYVALGDGGGVGDPWGNAQSRRTLLGKILRLDVDPAGGDPPDCGGGSNYSIPADNPFVDGPGTRCDEIWAYGLRNPWRATFDRHTGDLYIADVGQYSWEEVNFQAAGSTGGQDYGWNVTEGFHCYDSPTCDASGITFPVREYSHDGHCAVIGGYVYRGSQYPALWGYYLLADYCSGNFWTLLREDGVWVMTSLGILNATLQPSTFGQDVNGELYIASRPDGTIYQIQTDQVFLEYLPVMSHEE